MDLIIYRTPTEFSSTYLFYVAVGRKRIVHNIYIYILSDDKVVNDSLTRI